MMIFVEPTQTNVATIASPWCGLVGRKSCQIVVVSPSLPPCWSNAIPPVPAAATSSLGPLEPCGSALGAMASPQPTARSAPASNAKRFITSLQC